MYVLDVAVPADRDPSGVVESLRAALGRDGSVAVVRRDDALDRPAHTTVALGDAGWRASGPGERDLTAALDDLARDHAYAVTVGFADADLPRLAVGDAAAGDDGVLARVPDADALNTEAVRSALRETDPYESLTSLVAAAKRSPDATFSGAIATFTGRVRTKEDEGDDATESLTFEKYEGVAEARLDDIRTALEARDGVHEVLLHHRTGRIEAGADIVFVVALAGHRREAFRAVEDGIDRLKDEVPIFKKEVTVDDAFWVHEREE